MAYTMLREEEADESGGPFCGELPQTRMARVKEFGLASYTQDAADKMEEDDEKRFGREVVDMCSSFLSLAALHRQALVFLGSMLIFSTANSLAVYLILFQDDSALLLLVCAGLFGAELFCVHWFVFHE